MIFISERVVLAWWLVGQSQNPGQIHYFCRSVRDTGQELQIRDCPGRSGTVGTYEYHPVYLEPQRLFPAKQGIIRLIDRHRTLHISWPAVCDFMMTSLCGRS